MIFADRDFGIKFWVRPVRIAAKTASGVNVNVAFVAAVFFSEPEIGHVFEFGNFALNKVAIKF